MTSQPSNYDKFPRTPVTDSSADCLTGWDEILPTLNERVRGDRFIVCVESYPGVPTEELVTKVDQALRPELLIRTEALFRSEDEIDHLVNPFLGSDPVFGRMNSLQMEDFFDPSLLVVATKAVSESSGVVLIVGPGASLLSETPDLLLLAEISRWNLQSLHRQNISGNLGASNKSDTPGKKYKRAFFVDWRVADRLKLKLFSRFHYLLDLNDLSQPKMVKSEIYLEGLRKVASQPFRVVPFFDPGPWGGQWMKQKFALPDDKPNYAWCFDCVPEENSLRLGFGDRTIEVPALDLVLLYPEQVLGPRVVTEFGAEFPIRFDFLDTVEGGNLSLQVHPLRKYIVEHFGIPYTQDESYYILDQSPGSIVYLGLREGIDRQQMAEALRAAQEGVAPLDAEQFVNIWSSKKHDHFSVPGGTVHCSGRGNVVLEISATPYIFTFKLWDWGRMGLDGKPRPIHLEHGLANIQWNRTTSWVQENLFNKNEPLESGEGWREEKTGVHHSNFLETRRHWFTEAVPHQTYNTVNVLNLVEGDEVVVESPTNQFAPFVIHYAETFIIPAAVGAYTIRPSRPIGKPYATIKAFVRNALIR